MNQAHKNAFFTVADQFGCWIGLREPNPLADRWIGRPGYTPKAESCKAKTADDAAHPLGGLVVDPTLCPAAFRRDTVRQAVDTWQRKFLVGGRLPAGFTREESGRDKGLVKFRGAAIYADYDLMSIVRAGPQGEFVPTSNQEEKQLFGLVAPALNRIFGTPMIQHGAEFMWDGGVGARAFEMVLWFGPNHRFNQGPSSMPNPVPGGGH